MLLAALPFGAYTQPDGKCNLAAYAPEGACAPELQVRVRRAHGQLREPEPTGEGEGRQCEAGAEHGACVPLHLDACDTTTVLLRLGSTYNNDGATAATGETNAAMGGEDDVVTVAGQTVLPSHGAIWHIFSQSDSRVLAAALPRLIRQHTQRCPPGHSPALSNSTQPLLDGCVYLDAPAMALLHAECALNPYVVLQRLGDALLIPAGCAYQVRSLRSTVMVTAPFVAPEHVGHCVRLTEERRQLPAAHARRADGLGVRSLLLHAAWACLATLDDCKRRDERQRRALEERNRRVARQLAKQAAPADGKCNLAPGGSMGALPAEAGVAPSSFSAEAEVPALTANELVALDAAGAMVASALMLR